MDIKQPIIHDRHIVKQAFKQLKQLGEVKFEHPNNLTVVTCRNTGTLEDRIIPHLSGYEDKSILESNMDYLGLDLVVLKDDRLRGEILLNLKCYTITYHLINVLQSILCIWML